jgi:uncharacterized membrane protein
MPSEKPLAPRIALIDALRGYALAAMAVYHFSWDLGLLGLADLGVADNPLWIAFARATAASFLFLVGVSLVLAHGAGIRPRAFLRRLAMIVAAAALITATSWFADPDGVIWFGILHCIALSSVLGLAFLRLPVIAVVVAAALCLAAPVFLTSPLFNSPWLLWLGLATEAPPSNDYNPMLPWFGMVLLGIAAGHAALSRHPPPFWAQWQPHNAIERGVAFIGRHSLAFYLLHQPVLIGLLWLVARALGVPSA